MATNPSRRNRRCRRSAAVEVPYDADLRGVFASLRQAGERLRAESHDVLTDTEIDGITAFGTTTMTVRTSTKVRPGAHENTSAFLRLLINETFARQAGGAARKALIAEAAERHAARGA
jgi:small-conductance mechanosensitive channel